jgi:hypothetical protein
MKSSWLLLVAAACGSPHGGAPDGAPAAPDAAPDAPPSMPGCDWVQRDHTNAQETMPEYTGTPITLCGTIDLVRNGGPADAQASYKQFGFQSSVEQEVVVRFEAESSLDGWTNAYVALFTHDGGMIAGKHAVTAARLYGAGQTEYLEVSGDFPATVSSPIAYKITIAPMPRATICPTVGGAPDYTEAHDGAASDGNDMVRLDWDAQAAKGTWTLTASTTDAPEPTGYTLGGTTTHHAHGTSAAVAADSAMNHDVDTYEITTGPDVDELAVRVDWQGTADLPFMLVRPDLSVRQTNAEELPGTSQSEIWPVEPSTTYWVWVAGYSSSGTTGLPVDYDVSLCPGHSP